MSGAWLGSHITLSKAHSFGEEQEVGKEVRGDLPKATQLVKVRAVLG